MKFALTLLMFAAALPCSVNAIEASANDGPQAAQSAVTSMNNTTNASISALQSQLTAMQACQALGEFYQVGHAGADANGCWSNGGNATGTIVAFNGTTCPSGWSEYTAARGKFLRGIDNGAGYDPTGTRAPGNYQADTVGPHTHSFAANYTYYYGGGAYSLNSSYCGQCYIYASNLSAYTGTLSGATSSNGNAETRPRNIAVLYCIKD